MEITDFSGFQGQHFYCIYDEHRTLVYYSQDKLKVYDNARKLVIRGIYIYDTTKEQIYNQGYQHYTGE